MAEEKNLNTNYKNVSQSPYFASISDKNEVRVDFRNWYTMTIDGADAKDLDDAISLAKFSDGNILLGVHIADVSHYVTEKSPIDQEARRRGTSIYLPEKVIPMLPETLSNNLCSLTAESDKKTLSVLMKIDTKSGKVLHTDVVESIIRSQYRGIYEVVYEKFLNQDYSSDVEESTINTAFELYEILKKRRQKEGKISFDMTEIFFEFEDDSHTPTSIKKRTRNDAHMLIEECMVVANEEIAKWCEKRKIPYLSRLHDEPSEE